MVTTHTHKKLTWTDIINPTPEEVRALREEYSLSPDLTTDLGAPTPRSYSVCDGGAMKVSLDFPFVKRPENRTHEIKFIVTKTALISVRYNDSEVLDEFQKELEVNIALKKSRKSPDGPQLFSVLLSRLFASLGAKLDYLETKMVDIEEDISNEREKEAVVTISDVSRTLIAFRHTLKVQENVLVDTHAQLASCFTKKTAAAMAPIMEQYAILLERTQTLFETLEELRNMNFALLSTKQNEVMKILTIMAFITFPLSLFTSMFGMNTEATPLLGLQGDFWIIVAMMSIITLGFFLFFLYKKWI